MYQATKNTLFHGGFLFVLGKCFYQSCNEVIGGDHGMHVVIENHILHASKGLLEAVRMN